MNIWWVRYSYKRKTLKFWILIYLLADMNYTIKYPSQGENIIERLLKARNIQDNINTFLNPTIKKYRIDPFFLQDMEKAVKKIINTLKNNGKIMIFGDYDVDGITSSYILYDFISNQLKYKNISIQFPDRIKDWYGLKNKHIDMMKEKQVDMIITVDNGITSIQEAEYCRKLGIDLIITDHHKNLETIPDAYAVINPQVSPDYPFKGLAGVGVTFKLINALMKQSTLSEEKKKELFNYYLPIVAIGTVADIVPLVQENRAIVKRGLEILNHERHLLPRSLHGILEYLKLTTIDTFHIGFVIWPRINAWGRIDSPYKSLHTLLKIWEKQKESLQELEDINTKRRKMQEEMFKNAEKNIDIDKYILLAESEDFHEGIVGIISWRITEKYNKPSAIFKINKKEGIASASLRAPNYFNIVEMLQAHEELLERFWWHKQAWWLTVKLENLDTLKDKLYSYCEKKISEHQLEKIINVDTEIIPDDREKDILKEIENLAPFWEGNPEPTFILNNVNIQKVDKVWQKWKWHLKIEWMLWNKNIQCVFRWKGDEVKHLKEKEKINIIGKIKKDSYRGWQYINGIHYFE